MLCPQCFMKESTIDFDSDADIIDPDIIGPNNKITLLWVHGAVSCRKMFKIHA